MGLFSGIGSAKSNGGGVYFLPGIYTLECKACKTGETREGKKPFFVAEFTILESTNPDRPVGSTVSWMVMMDKYLETALGNIKQCAAALFGIPETDVDEAGVEALISAANPAAGIKVKAEATNIKTRAQKDFTKVLFTHIPVS
jgi:hypothetical protein